MAENKLKERWNAGKAAINGWSIPDAMGRDLRDLAEVSDEDHYNA